MEKEGQILQGVAIPPEAVAKSDALKAKRGKTLASLPVFRDAASLLLEVILIVKGGPKSLRGFYDEIIGNTTEIMKTIGRLREKIHGFNRQLAEKDELSVLDCQRIEQVVNSYLGFCRQYRTYRIRREALPGFRPEFFRYFYIRGHYDSIRAKAKYRPATRSAA